MDTKAIYQGIVYIGVLACLGQPLGSHLYRGHQINQAPLQREYSLSEGRTESLLGVMRRGGAFDRDGDGQIEEIIEVGSIAAMVSPSRGSGIPTSRVLRESDPGFDERLKLFE